MNHTNASYSQHILFAEMPAPAEEVIVVAESQLPALKELLKARHAAAVFEGNHPAVDIYGSHNDHNDFPELGVC